MPFFTYSQNNSGGEFVSDFDDTWEERGIGHYVIIEARDHLEANVFAEDLGLYFDGVSDGRDCGCCGDRWNAAYEESGEPDPRVYGKPVVFVDKLSDDRYGVNGFVHYRDGRIAAFSNGRGW